MPDGMCLTECIILNPAVEAIKNCSCFDRLGTNGFFVLLTKRVRRPFALSSPHSGRVEGLIASELPDLGS